jgi:hypothetical protein
MLRGVERRRPTAPRGCDFGSPRHHNRSVQTHRRDLHVGALADGFAAFAQPLIDQTDGSMEQMEKAFAISQFCYNFALFPDELRDKSLGELRSSLGMVDEEFDDFRRSILDPMVRRHQEMFPRMHRRVSTDPERSGPSLQAESRKAAPADKYPVTDRYAPCPCNSGEKYKFCCGAKRR